MGGLLDNDLRLASGSHGLSSMIWIGQDSKLTPLQVTMRDSIYRPMLWSSLKAQGPAIIRSISEDSNELQKIFGADYQNLMGCMTGNSKADAGKTASKTTSANASAPSRPPVVPPARTAATAATSTSGRREVLLTPAVNRTHNQSTSATQPSTSTGQANKCPAPSGASSATQTVKKQKKAISITLSEDIIDRCSDSGA